MPPRFLQALDHVHAADDGYVADCPICRDLLLIEPDGGTWTLSCDSGCSHDEIVAWCAITDLRVDPTWGPRAWVCLMLATTPHTWAALLNGEPVNNAALDPTYLARFRAAGILP